jgi:hypothetical protein
MQPRDRSKSCGAHERTELCEFLDRPAIDAPCAVVSKTGEPGALKFGFIARHGVLFEILLR